MSSASAISVNGPNATSMKATSVLRGEQAIQFWPDQSDISRERSLLLAGLNATRTQCQALSKRSANRRRKTARKSKHVCRSQGGALTGPKTEDGRKHCADTRTVHGRATRSDLGECAAKLSESRQLKAEVIQLGMIKPG